jgi:hypothetical protein
MTREEAIQLIDEIASSYYPCDKKDALEMAIKALEQESQTFEWCHDCSEYDHEKHCCPRFNNVIRKTVEEIKQPCEDTISRKKALEALKQEEPLVWCGGADEIAAYNQWSSDVDTIKNMPPVQPKPKTGHWIEITNNRGTVIALRCSCCGKSPKHAIKSDFCPNCGVEMMNVPDKNDGKLSEIPTDSDSQESENA